MSQLIRAIREGRTLDQINADRRTHRAINRLEFAGHLLATGLDDKLVAVLADTTAPDQLKAVARKVQTMASSDWQSIHTQRPDYAAVFGQGVDAMQQAGLVTADEVAAIYALGGGLLWPEPITQAEYDAAAAQVAREDQMQALIGEAYAKLNAFVARCEGWAATGEGAAPVIEEL